MRARRCVSPVQAVVGLVAEGPKGRRAHNNNKAHNNSKASGNRANDGAEVLLYLERLQRLVPLCPKDRPVTKLELIQSVIDYIYDLEDVLGAGDDDDDEELSEELSEEDEDMDCHESS